MGYVITRPFQAGALSGSLRVVVQDRVTGSSGSVTIPAGKS
jgi:hypothetical protein